MKRTRDDMLAEIRRTAAANGGVPLGKQRFEAETGIRESDWSGRYWVKWSDAVREAGCVPNQMQEALPDAVVLSQLAAFVRELGRIPVSAELRLKSRTDLGFPSHNTFARFGSKAGLVSALARWTRSAGDWDDVAALCGGLDSPIVEAVPSEADATSEIEFVYLMKSGRYFKIGRSNSPGRREYELAIQLPEPVKKIHEIATDDPVGIERYWHERFKHRRKNGEWFELTPQDVAAFRRRKFM